MRTIDSVPAFADGTVLLPWQPGPRHDISGQVCVSVTDFQTGSESGVRQIYELGTELVRTWPVMQGAVGLWLWGRPAEFRGGSITVWETERDMRRFVRWPVHTEIVRAWRSRVTVATDLWHADAFDPVQVLTRARGMLDRPHGGAA
ncbi:hypothetical protein [Nocardia crassostreae]|uniref:hypothetical protein n=1 Tax=Nocardia crassostreae TaxID=53428 RepID=UPI000B31A34F|nr:hypothetical protein [Nocardia crassostreae]